MSTRDHPDHPDHPDRPDHPDHPDRPDRSDHSDHAACGQFTRGELWPLVRPMERVADGLPLTWLAADGCRRAQLLATDRCSMLWCPGPAAGGRADGRRVGAPVRPRPAAAGVRRGAHRRVPPGRGDPRGGCRGARAGRATASPSKCGPTAPATATFVRVAETVPGRHGGWATVEPARPPDIGKVLGGDGRRSERRGYRRAERDVLDGCDHVVVAVDPSGRGPVRAAAAGPPRGGRSRRGACAPGCSVVDKCSEGDGLGPGGGRGAVDAADARRAATGTSARVRYYVMHEQAPTGLAVGGP